MSTPKSPLVRLSAALRARHDRRYRARVRRALVTHGTGGPRGPSGPGGPGSKRG